MYKAPSRRPLHFLAHFSPFSTANRLKNKRSAGCVPIQVLSSALYCPFSARWRQLSSTVHLLQKGPFCLCFYTAKTTEYTEIAIGGRDQAMYCGGGGRDGAPREGAASPSFRRASCQRPNAGLRRRPSPPLSPPFSPRRGFHFAERNSGTSAEHIQSLESAKDIPTTQNLRPAVQ